MASSDGDETFSDKKSKHEDEEADGDAARGGDHGLGIRRQRDYRSHHSYQQSRRVLVHLVPPRFSPSSASCVIAMEDGARVRERGCLWRF